MNCWISGCSALPSATNEFYHRRRQTKRPSFSSLPPTLLSTTSADLGTAQPFQYNPSATEDVDMAPLDACDGVLAAPPPPPPPTLPSQYQLATDAIALIPHQTAPSPPPINPFVHRRRTMPDKSDTAPIHHSQPRPAGPTLSPSERSSYITAATSRSFLTVLFPGKTHSLPDPSPVQARPLAAPIRLRDDRRSHSSHRLSQPKFHILPTYSFNLAISFGPSSSSGYQPPPPPVYFPMNQSSNPLHSHSPSDSPITPPPSLPVSYVNEPLHWTDRHLTVLRELGLDPPPFSPSKAEWLEQFILSSHWLHTSMPSRSPDEAYADAWIDYQNPPSRLEEFYYSYPHFSIFQGLAELSSVDNVWPKPSRRILAALLAAESELSEGLKYEYESFMHFHAREVLLIQAVAGYSELIDDVMDNRY